MKRGELTNQPAPVVAVDWRVLIAVEPVWGGLRKKVILKEGAKSWIERNWQVRMCGVMVGNEPLHLKVRDTLSKILADFEWFKSAFDLRIFLKRNPQVFMLFTGDKTMLSLDGNVRMFSGWNEVIYGL